MCVKQLFVDDYIDGILSSWYTRAALWIPTGRPLDARCDLCHESALAEVIDLTFWPHDLVHHLVLAVAGAVQHVGASLSEELSPLDPRGAISIERTAARGMVIASLSAHSDEMLDVLEQCVRYRLDDFESELEHRRAEFG